MKLRHVIEQSSEFVDAYYIIETGPTLFRAQVRVQVALTPGKFWWFISKLEMNPQLFCS